MDNKEKNAIGPHVGFKAEQNLEFMKMALDNVLQAVFLIDEYSHIRYVNEQACRSLGYSCEELLQMGIADIDPVFPMERWHEHWLDKKRLGLVILETHHKTKDGRIFPVEVNAGLVECNGREYGLCFVHDITDRKHAEEKILKQQKALQKANDELERRVEERTLELFNLNAQLIKEIETRKQKEDALLESERGLELRIMERTSELKTAHDRLHNLAVHLQSVREEERTKIARDIHDEFGQELTALKMDLSWLRQEYGDHKPIFGRIDAMLDKLNTTVMSIKRICTELRPDVLDDFGLVAAMEWQANEFEKRTGIGCMFGSEPKEIEIDKELSTVLFRIFQEALTNVIKHAKATKVIARLIQNDNSVKLEVVDNGKGITDKQLSKPKSFGLMGMRERVYPWGGNAEICGTEGIGTTVKVIVPLPPTSSTD